MTDIKLFETRATWPRGEIVTVNAEPDAIRGALFRSLRTSLQISLRLATEIIGCNIVTLSEVERSEIAIPDSEWRRISEMLEAYSRDLRAQSKDLCIIYFGCLRGAGHYTHERGKIAMAKSCPWGERAESFRAMDPSTYANRNGKGAAQYLWMGDDIQTEGAAVLSTLEGWTRLGWPDRSVDHRPGSHSNIIVNKTCTFEQIIEFGKINYPDVFSRISYEIKLAKTFDLNGT